MGMQSFRGAGGAGAVRTSLGTTLDEHEERDSDIDGARAHSSRDQRRGPRGRGWVLSLDVERRMREVRERVAGTSSHSRPLDDADDVALLRPCRAGF